MWPFRKKPPPTPPEDHRVWNEDWQIGDTAKCVNDRWGDSVPPWERPKIGRNYIISGFKECIADNTGTLIYGLILDGLTHSWDTVAFRKVRPNSTEESEVVKRILNAKPGADNPREPAETDPNP